MKKGTAKKEILVPSDLSLVQGASQEALSFLKPLRLSEGFLFDIRLCLEEALINAMKYGNQLNKGLTAKLDVEYDDQEVRIGIEDRGDGYDPKKLKDCTSGDNLLRGHGRGVHLIHQLMDRVEYNSKGNRILMAKSLKSGIGAGGSKT